MIEKITRRTKKTVIFNVEKLIRKHGYEQVRCVINHFFQERRETKKLEEEVKSKELELQKLRSRIGR